MSTFLADIDENEFDIENINEILKENSSTEKGRRSSVKLEIQVPD